MNPLVAIIHRLSKSIAVLCIIAVLMPAAAGAQPASRPQDAATTPSIGAGEIFDVLTRPDAPSDLQRLRALRDALAGNPDPRTLNDMRAQLDSLLRDAEHRQGELPPALVMSGIASRIDGAITRLEAAHPPAPVQPFQGPPWLLPALGALSGTLAIGLVVCLAALAAQARSVEENEDMRETLGRIKRKLDDVASGARRTSGAFGDLAGDDADTLQEAGVSITRLNMSAKEAEAALRTSAEAAEARLQGAVAVASQLETWLEELPGRLNRAIGQAEGSAPGALDAAVQLSDQALLLPDFLSSVQEACDEMRVTTEALAQANLAASMPTTVELGETAALASEMTNLCYGHAMKLEDVIGQLVQATEILPELGNALAEALAQVPQQIARNVAVTENFEAASARAEASWAQLGQFVEEQLPEKLAALTDCGTAALAAASEQFTGLANVAAAAASEVPASLQSLRDVISAFAEAGARQQAAIEDANMRLANLADLLPEAGTSLAASAEALKRHVVRDTKREAVSRAAIGEISAAAQAARADLAAAADAVAAMPAQNDRLAALLSHGEQLLAGLEAKAMEEAEILQRARNEALAGVEVAIGKMQIAAERLHAGADAQEHALARVRRAALTVATLAGADAALGSVSPDEADPAAQAG